MNTDFKLDMTMMLLVHDAFRRDLELVATTTARSEGWDRFAKLLHLHHTAEDEALWPVLRNSLVGHPEDLALVDEMEAQHAALDPLLEAIESSLDGGDPAPRRGPNSRRCSPSTSWRKKRGRCPSSTARSATRSGCSSGKHPQR